MTSISMYPHSAFRRGNEAVAVGATSLPGEALCDGSVLGKALYETTDVLKISTYPCNGVVVLEGSIDKIDKRRRKLNRLAPEIATRALQQPYWKSSLRPSRDELTYLVGNFGAPTEDDSFYNRMLLSVEGFANLTSNDLEVYKHNTPYERPLDSRIGKIHDTVRKRDSKETSIEELQELLEAFQELGGVDRLTLGQEVLSALIFYASERSRDPSLKSQLHYLQQCEKSGLKY